MLEPRVDSIRNVALVGSTGVGKTSIAEALLHAAGVIPAMGSVPAGNTVSDFEPEEIHRKFSVSSTVSHFSWKDILFNLIDTPGAAGFLGETKAALRAVDGVILVIGESGVRSDLDAILTLIDEAQLPCILFFNALDKERTDWAVSLKACQEIFKKPLLPVTIPLGAERQLTGVIDVVRCQALPSNHHLKGSEDIAPNVQPAIVDARKTLIEGIAEIDDRLLEKYLSGEELSAEEMTLGLKKATQIAACIPVLCGSAVHEMGTTALLEAISAFLPSPKERASQYPSIGVNPNGEPCTRNIEGTEPFSGFVFKTIIDPFVGRLSYVRVVSGALEADGAFYNASKQTKEKGGHLFTILGKKYTAVGRSRAGEIVAIGKLKDTQTGDTICDEHYPIRYPTLQLMRPVMSFAIEPKAKADIEKVSLGLHKLVEEDPSLEFSRNQETKEMILSGTGQLHVDVTFEKLRRKYGAEVIVHTPKVPYKETIRKMAQAQGKYKKQTGGHGQFGDCWLQIDPLPRGAGFEFVNRVVGGAIPRNFIPAVEKGVIEALHEGILAGYPVVDIRVTVYDGSYHTVDSSEMSFKIAGSMAVKKALESAHAVLLEPIMSVEVVVPDEVVGAVIGDLNSRRGRIVGVTAKGTTETIQAQVPLADMLKYSLALNAVTGGRGHYAMGFSTYEEVPRDHAGRIIDEQKSLKHALAH